MSAGTLPPIITLATFGPVTFARVDGIFAIDPQGRLIYHCSLEEWPGTPEARAARLDTEIADAEAHLATLQAQRAKLAPSRLLPAPAADPELTPTGRRKARRVRCAGCGELLVEGFFRKHVERKHPDRDPGELERHPDLPWPVEPVEPAAPPAEPAAEAEEAARGN